MKMKSLLKLDVKNILLILLIGIVIFQQCGKTTETPGEIIEVDGKKYELLEHRIDTVYEEKIVEVPKYTPQYIEKIVEVEVQIPQDIDSLEIIKEYFSKFVVKDTVVLEGLGKGYITDIITQNKIESREIRWDYRIPTVLDTKIVKELPRNQLYVGLNVNFDRLNLVNSVGGGLLLKTKRDRIYQLNTGMANSITGETQPYLGGGLYWKIKIRK
jgi:hypothetical protein